MTMADDPDQAGARKRAAKRDSLFLLADIRRESGEALGRARIRNLSETGLMADCERVLGDDDRLVVDLRGIGEVAGRVAWVRGDRIGMVFDQHIVPQDARRPVGKGQDATPAYLRPLAAPQVFRR